MAIVYSTAEYLIFIVVVTVLVRPLGGYVERVFSGILLVTPRVLATQQHRNLSAELIAKGSSASRESPSIRLTTDCRFPSG